MAEKKKDNRAVWFVKFPTYVYVQDVKQVARKNDLRIVDARFQGDQKQVEKAPTLTLRKEFQPKVEADEK